MNLIRTWIRNDTTHSKKMCMLHGACCESFSKQWITVHNCFGWWVSENRGTLNYFLNRNFSSPSHRNKLAFFAFSFAKYVVLFLVGGAIFEVGIRTSNGYQVQEHWGSCNKISPNVNCLAGKIWTELSGHVYVYSLVAIILAWKYHASIMAMAIRQYRYKGEWSFPQ